MSWEGAAASRKGRNLFLIKSRFKRAARWLVNGVREWLADGKE